MFVAAPPEIVAPSIPVLEPNLAFYSARIKYFGIFKIFELKLLGFPLLIFLGLVEF